MSSMGMDKSGNQTIALSTWVKVVTWTIRSGYASTVITSDAMVMNISGTGSIRYRGSFTQTGLGTQQFRVVKNGTTVLGTANTNTTTTISSAAVAVGDTLELQAFSTNNSLNVVSSGSSNTFVEFNQLTVNYTIGATPSIGWASSAALKRGQPIDVAPSIGWVVAASLNRSGPIGATPSIGWNVAADLYKGIFYDIGATPVVGWNVEADLLHIPKVATPPSIFDVTSVSASVHTVDGRIVGAFPCTMINTFSWGREDTEVSSCSMDLMTQGDPELVEELRHWIHWITMWHDDTPVWTGPIMSINITKSVTTISAKDPAAFMARTRVPITRTFTDSAPARMADVLWREMFQLHGIRTTPIVLPGIVENTFTIAAVADSKMLTQLMGDLVKVGLHWTVVAGRPVLGMFDNSPVAELAECDFKVELHRRRDGTRVFNDVRVQGQNWAQTAIVELAGLRLQTIVSLDDMFGASNIQRASQQYAASSAQLRDELVVPADAGLVAQAPVSLDDLIPGKVFAIHTETISQLMRLDQMTVSGSSDSIDVQVTLAAVQKPTEIAKLIGSV